MNNKLNAVIDLGSNTFHLLIVNVTEQGSFETLLRKRVFTGLSDGGVDVIKKEKIISGLETIQDFKKILTTYRGPQLKVIGTAVLRKASNRMEFISPAEDILGTKIDIIDGIREADLIYKGMLLLDGMQTGTHLIMDIGGGSTEFILIKEGKKAWSNSYPLGVGILHELFHKSDPITLSELEALKTYVLETIADMIAHIKEHKPAFLAGASGSFEILQSMSGYEISHHEISHIDVQQFYDLHDIIINADETERAMLQGLPPERIKLIVVGMALKKIIVDLIRPQSILVSPYALKEGVIHEMLSF